MKYQWVDEIDGRVATENNMGFMFTDINGSTPAFLDYVVKCAGTIIDIGCAYGVATLPALEKSKAKIIAFDLSQAHLNGLREFITPQQAGRITYVKGAFPNDFNYENNSLDAIHISYVLHYLSGEDFELGIKKCYDALKPDGKLFINTLSVHFCLFKHLVADYEEKLAQGVPWPGIVDGIKDNQLSQSDSDNVPDSINLVSLAFLEQLLVEHHYTIDEAFYYDIKKPNTFGSDDKGCIAVVASK
ncbi:MAG: class I SAM-dependent methyltransferase [Pseudomonadota bacterium]